MVTQLSVGERAESRGRQVVEPKSQWLRKVMRRGVGILTETKRRQGLDLTANALPGREDLSQGLYAPAQLLMMLMLGGRNAEKDQAG